MGRQATVVGGGNGALTVAGALAQCGHQVLVFEHPDWVDSLSPIHESKRLLFSASHVKADGSSVVGALQGEARIHATTLDAQEACAHSDTLLMVVPGYAQEPLFRLLMPHLRDHHTVVLFPGNFGSFVLRRLMGEAALVARPTIVEAATMPFACRRVGPNEVFVLAKKNLVELGVWPAMRGSEVVAAVGDLLAMVVKELSSVVEAGLSNLNMVVHPATAVLNMGICESRQGQFQFYREGMSPSVARVLDLIDTERLAIGSRFGIALPSFCESVFALYEIKASNLLDFSQNTEIHSSIENDAPHGATDRYISEDCPYSMTPTWSLGRAADYTAETIQCILQIASRMNSTDYMVHGRNTQTMGIGGMTPEGILDFCMS